MIKTLAFFILLLNSAHAYEILSTPRQIADTLVDAGHNVTMLLPVMNPAVADGSNKVHKIYVEPDPVVKHTYESHTEMNIIERSLFNPITPLFLGPLFASNIGRTCEKMLAEPGLIERLREEKYDVYIAENFEVCGIGISAAIQPKAFEEYGVPQALSYRPTLFYAHLDVHSFFSRLTNLIGEVFIRTQFWFPRRACDGALRKRFGDEYPSVAEQSSNIAYLFTNSEPLIETTPTFSRVIDISHIGAREPKPLDEKWSEILSRRPRVILVSFGSMVKSYLFPINTKLSILKLEDEFSRGNASRVDNLVLTEWMPQIDILNHPSLVAFITHGDMGSVQEAAARGVPGVFIPIFGDQPRNAGMMVRNGLGLVYDKFALADVERLTATVREVVDNEKYRAAARRISRMLARKPFKPKEQLVKHVEFAAEFGASSAFRPRSHDMSYIAYHNLDLIFALFIFTVLSLSGTVKIALFIMRKCFRVVKVKSE
ncbi:hypothetical protein PRIPAC_81201 [Pristionchus pacificus]|uniref:glucuronosyltransferase n=1 Tax=Pristionchus pacificus TaxID=54126 RepID=A0A2A6CNA5_PRIPA|nr:hypothetical protein PRIPAC_81201 [Pristionchus pacificus]|eukprot:PDM79580.1 Glycosyltransferase [Pristionchus pacificus]